MQCDPQTMLDEVERLAAEPAVLRSFLAAVDSFYAEVDGRLSSLAAEQVLDLACGPGCFHCCPPTGVETELFEVIPVLVELNRKPSQPLLKRIVSRSGEARSGFTRGTSSFLSLLHLKETPPRGARQEEACPFLNDGLCAIYRVRPLACRLHVSVSRMTCAEARRPDLPRVFYAALNRTVASAAEALMRKGMSPFMGSGGLLVHGIGWEEGEEACTLRLMGRRFALSPPGG